MTMQLELSKLSAQNAINDLVDLTCIPAIDKAHILLVANGNKPSMHTAIFTEQVPTPEVQQQSDISNIDQLMKIIDSLQLCCKRDVQLFTDEVNGVTMYSNRILFCIARQMSVVDQLIASRQQGDIKQEGLLLGFPESAIDAYVRNDVIEVSDWPMSTEQVTIDEMKFLNHMISKSHWEDEISYLPEHARMTRCISQKIYDQCVSD